jgi:hypothetical protein
MAAAQSAQLFWDVGRFRRDGICEGILVLLNGILEIPKIAARKSPVRVASGVLNAMTRGK